MSIGQGGCIRKRNDDGEYISRLPPFQDYGGPHNDRITDHHQAIITSYKFDCSNQMCGNITAWGVDVERDGRPHDMAYSIDFQVWRPSPTMDDSTGTGCYSLVGNNRFTSIALINREARVTPSPGDYIQFQPGDVLGFYVEVVAKETDNGIVILNSDMDDSFASERVWYASIAPAMATSQNRNCPYSVGSSGVLNTLTRAAPVISISTGNSIELLEPNLITDIFCAHRYFPLSSTTFNGYSTAYSSTRSHH